MYLKNQEDDTHKLLETPTSPKNQQKNFDIERQTEKSVILPEFIKKEISIFEKSKTARIVFCCFLCCKSNKHSTTDITQSEIQSYHSLKAIAVQAYNENDFNHEKSLKMLFLTCLNTTEVTEDLRHKDWKIVGFQSENPRTDFRGSGYLSLLFIIYFIKQNEKEYREMIEFEFFLFAVVAIKLVVRIIFNLN
jgi:hypothetical protein